MLLTYGNVVMLFRALTALSQSPDLQKIINGKCKVYPDAGKNNALLF